MSSSVSPASAIASRLASTASESGSTMSRRPNVERPMPLRTARCSKRSSLTGARGSGRTGSSTRSTGSTDPVSSKSGSHTSSCCSKRTVTSWPICDVGRLAADDVRRQVDAGVLGQRDVGDDVRAGRSPGSQRWALTVKPDDGAAARHRRSASTTGSGSTGRWAPADGPAGRSRCSPGCAGCRRRRRSRTTRWPESARGAAASPSSGSGAPPSIDIDVVIEHRRHVTPGPGGRLPRRSVSRYVRPDRHRPTGSWPR